MLPAHRKSLLRVARRCAHAGEWGPLVAWVENYAHSPQPVVKPQQPDGTRPFPTTVELKTLMGVPPKLNDEPQHLGFWARIKGAFV